MNILFSIVLNMDGFSDPDLENRKVFYFLPSKLHRLYIEWRLFLDDSFTGTIEEGTVVEFVMCVISRFDPIALGKRLISPGTVQQTQEAQYQDEFYRCSHAFVGDSVAVLPEYGMPSGRVNLYARSKQWGIELLRDGDKLDEHVERFPQYGKYTGLPIHERLHCPGLSHRSS